MYLAITYAVSPSYLSEFQWGALMGWQTRECLSKRLLTQPDNLSIFLFCQYLIFVEELSSLFGSFSNLLSSTTAIYTYSLTAVVSEYCYVWDGFFLSCVPVKTHQVASKKSRRIPMTETCFLNHKLACKPMDTPLFMGRRHLILLYFIYI